MYHPGSGTVERYSVIDAAKTDRRDLRGLRCAVPPKAGLFDATHVLIIAWVRSSTSWIEMRCFPTVARVTLQDPERVT